MSCTNGKCWGCAVEYKNDRSKWCAFCFARPVYVPDYRLEEELESVIDPFEEAALKEACDKSWVDKIKPMLDASKNSLWMSEKLRNVVTVLNN